MPGRKVWLAVVALASTGLAATGFVRGSSINDDNSQGGAAVAQCVKIDGALLERTKDGFKAIKAGAAIPAQTMLIGFPDADLLVRSGKVGIKMLVYIGEALPVTESAISLQESGSLDADIALDRGVIALKNMGKGDGTVRIRAATQTWELTFKDADSAVLVARFGRHEPGTKLFKTGPKKERGDDPLMHLGVLVVKGRVSVNTGRDSYALHAPPGPALVGWDSGAGYEVKRLETLPEEAHQVNPAEQKQFKEVCAITAKLAAGDLGKGLDEMVASDSVSQRRVAVACMGALDDLPRLWAALENPKHKDVREQAVHTLRNWVGRQPGQLTKLQEHLTKTTTYGPAQVRTITQLLKGFDDQDRKEPLVYQLLIAALEHAPLPIRELAHWHLDRLAPAGQSIAYDSTGDEAARQKAVAQWRQLIPEGQLPPPPKKDEVKKKG